MKNKICIIEDDNTLQLVLSYELRNCDYEVEVASDGLEGLNLLKSNNFDLAIIDWMLPNMSGIDIIKEIRKDDNNIRIIMLTAKDNEMDIVEGLDSGADDYLTKPFSTRELKARVKSMLRINHNSNIRRINNLIINLDTRSVMKDDISIDTSKLEFDILLFFLDNKNKVLTREMIFNYLWNEESDVNIRVIDNHISNLKRKLELKNNLITKRGVGYMFVD
ncbi:MAG: response regulator transcription factor [Bacilli bacterium]|jgi:two-component system alkaline phosphatase synthesis response regulator PhoP|nr:response regulator transcription factor [Bacilli bacterium]